MGIRKKFFLISAAFILIILIISYSVMYLYFYRTIFRETVINQRTNVELNRRMADNFMESTYQTSVQLVSDQALGEYLSENSSNPMEIIQARLAIQDQFAHYATHQAVNSSYYYRSTLFLSDLLPIAGSFEPRTLDDNPYVSSNSVLSNSRVKEEEWYQKTLDRNVYVFLNQDTDEICIARKITNTYYIGPYDSNGTAVLVVSVASSQIESVFSSIPITPQSGYAILNDEGTILYRSNTRTSSGIYDAAWKESGYGQDSEFTMRADGQVYLVNYCQPQYGIQLLFVTPSSDIEDSIQSPLGTYSLIFVSISLVILAGIYIITGRLSRPLIRFSDAVAQIRDPRNYDPAKLRISKERELVMLENSFHKLIENIRIHEESEKRSQLRALQAQINPHFIFNAMDMVNWLALSRNCDDIAGIVSSIANMMRYSITDADSMVPIWKEMENIQEFISIYRLRHNSQPILQTDIQEREIMIPKFTLQPLVENSVRHARTAENEKLVIVIRACRKETQTIIEVHDNGRNCDAETLNRHIRYEDTDLNVSSGFGIRNVNERINLRFGKGSGIFYSNGANGSLIAHVVLTGDGKWE